MARHGRFNLKGNDLRCCAHKKNGAQFLTGHIMAQTEANPGATSVHVDGELFGGRGWLGPGQKPYELTPILSSTKRPPKPNYVWAAENTKLKTLLSGSEKDRGGPRPSSIGMEGNSSSVPGRGSLLTAWCSLVLVGSPTSPPSSRSLG